MSDDNSMSVVNLGKLAKPADTLIKKVSSAIGGVFEPWQIKRVAKANAEASLIEAQTEIEITDLHRRAMHRFVEEEANRQENMEQITKKALPQLKADSDPDRIEDDWVTNFFDKSRIVSDTEMQDLWARVLAGEANSPGTYSKRTVNFLGDLDKRDAEMFLSVCRFLWMIGSLTPLIFDSEAPIYNDHGVTFTSLSHLDTIGLIQFGGISGFVRQGFPKSFAVAYCGQVLKLEMPNDKDNKLDIGKVLLTKVGYEIASVCSPLGVDGFYDYIKDKWKSFAPSTEIAEQANPEGRPE